MQTYRAILPYVSPTYAAAYLLPKNAQRYNDEIVEIWFAGLETGALVDGLSAWLRTWHGQPFLC